MYTNEEQKKHLHSYILKNKEINGVLFTEEDSKTIPSYMTEFTEKDINGNDISKFYKDIYEVITDEKQSILLAKLLKNGLELDKILYKKDNNNRTNELGLDLNLEDNKKEKNPYDLRGN